MSRGEALSVRPVQVPSRLGAARFGLWLFLASEAVLFLTLFATYAVLRLRSDAWPRGADQLGVAFGAVNSLVLVASSVSMLGAWWAARRGVVDRARTALLATATLGALFVLVKSFEWALEIRAGGVPSASHFHALYYLLTGLHVVHALGGIVVLGYLWASGRSAGVSDPERFAGRVELCGIYWHFVDIAWLVLFALLYLT
jgi:heme/copper-type cytochrome/quinol oxidase subunit 3